MEMENPAVSMNIQVDPATQRLVTMLQQQQQQTQMQNLAAQSSGQDIAPVSPLVGLSTLANAVAPGIKKYLTGVQNANAVDPTTGMSQNDWNNT